VDEPLEPGSEPSAAAASDKDVIRQLPRAPHVSRYEMVRLAPAPCGGSAMILWRHRRAVAALHASMTSVTVDRGSATRPMSFSMAR